jgi:hypothetical protein
MSKREWLTSGLERTWAQRDRGTMTLIKRLIFSAVFLFVVVYAYGQDVHYNYDKGTNFSSYKTYQWVNLPTGAPDQLIDQAIRRAVDSQLAQKGLTRVEKDADLYIGYQTAVTQEKAVNLFGSGNRGFGWGGWGTASVQGETSTIQVGTLVVQLYDPARKQLIWRGDATRTIDLKKDPDKNYNNLQKAMAKLFKNYPPK